MRISSSAPTRIDLAGGTLDIWPLYLFHDDAQTLNAAITLRAECTVTPSLDGRLHIVSEDTGTAVQAAHWSELKHATANRLVARILYAFRAEGLRVVTRSGSPVGAGIAGSSALNVAVCAALAAWQGQDWPPERLLARAMNIEAQAIDVPTGAQDYRPAMYGGVAAIELDVDGIRRVPLPVPPAELEERIVLAYTGESRQSGINNWEITKRHIDGDRAVFDLFEQIRDTAVSMRQALVRGDWPEVGRQIGAEWSLRRQLAPGVSTPAIDALILHAARAGARAAKVCGAGGGGCVLFLADPDRTAAVRRAIAEAGTRLLDCRIDTDGLRIAHSESA